MKKFLVLLATTTVLGACAENKSSNNLDGGSRLFDDPPVAFACPKKTDKVGLDATIGKLDKDDQFAQAQLRDYFERVLAEEKLYETYVDSWMGLTRGPSVKPIIHEELERVVKQVTREAQKETDLIIRKFGETGVKWTAIHDLMVRVLQAKYDNGNPVAPGNAKGKIAAALVWCADTML